MANSTKAIVFDLYGVNAHRDENQMMNLFATTLGSSPEEIHRAIEQSGRALLKVGGLTPRKYVNRLNKNLHSNLTIQEVRTIWNKSLRIDPNMIALLKTLKQRYPLFLLSNLNDLDWQAINQTELVNYFDDFFLSFELKIKKPDPLIFQEVVDITGTPANNLLFIDDQAKNTTVAAQLGMQSIQFKDAPTLHHQLHRLNIL